MAPVTATWCCRRCLGVATEGFLQGFIPDQARAMPPPSCVLEGPRASIRSKPHELSLDPANPLPPPAKDLRAIRPTATITCEKRVGWCTVAYRVHSPMLPT